MKKRVRNFLENEPKALNVMTAIPAGFMFIGVIATLVAAHF